MSEIQYYSAEGLAQLKEELLQLETVERPRISAMIAEARDKGDLSENAEYDSAKEAQGLLEMKIAKLQNLIANARVLDESKLDTSKILIYSRGSSLFIQSFPSRKPTSKKAKFPSLRPLPKGCSEKKWGMWQR